MHYGFDKDWKPQTFEHVGQGIVVAVERFTNIAELIANDNPEVKEDMLNSCRSANDAGKSIQHLCVLSSTTADPKKNFSIDQEAVIFACRALFSSITRILLLVDIAIVKQLLTSKKYVARSLKKIDSILHFTDFVRAFSVFGKEMVELALLTGCPDSIMKEERRKAQMSSARLILERSITVLLTASKTSLTHRECMLAKENRDTVFCQIRRAMDLIHFVVKDCVFGHIISIREPTVGYKSVEKGTARTTCDNFLYALENFHYKVANQHAIHDPIGNINMYSTHHAKQQQQQSQLIENNWPIDGKVLPYDETDNYAATECKKSPIFYSSAAKAEIIYILDRLMEKIQDFTDCAYTSHEHRQNILFLCYRCRQEVNKYFHRVENNECVSAIDIETVSCVVKKLSDELVLSVNDQVIDLYHSLKVSVNLTKSFYVFAIKQDMDQMQEFADRFHDHCDHIIDVCKLLRHIATTDPLQIEVKYLSMNLRIYGPQVLTAAKIVMNYPCSTAANENYEAFFEIWKWLTSEIAVLSKSIVNLKKQIKQNSQTPVKDSSTVSQVTKPLTPKFQPKDAVEEKAPAPPTAPADDGQEGVYNRNATGTDNDKWSGDLSDNDILKRAKSMSAMAFSMYQFTKGNGTLKTTQDLFTQAEYFAEEANRLYKILRQFSYQVPAGDNKKELLNILDRVPTFVQTLQFTVKDHTVGKAATFVKVDHVIRETKNLMNVINKVVNNCFECANKYNLDFSGLSGGVTSGSLRGEDNSSGGMSDSKGVSNSTEGSM